MSESVFATVLENFEKAYERSLEKDNLHQFRMRERGVVTNIADGVARIRGLPGIGSQELVEFPEGLIGMALNLDRESVGVVLLGDYQRLRSGTSVRRSNRVADVPVGDELLGRVLSPTGRPLDKRGAIQNEERRAIEQPAPSITHRNPVKRPLQTGIKAVDALLPLGRGQRELIVGDRQTGKTAIALDTILNQRDSDVICVYCAIGQEQASIARFLASLEEYEMRERTILVVATGDNVPGLKYIAPYSATTMAEYFMQSGRDVLIIYDDLTHHARAYRELSLLLRRPPGREAYPGDIFYVHSRLLERATQLNDEQGGGSLTALPIVETQAQNISAYIPTNLISITDGQIYLSPKLFQKGILPAIDVGRSVSRVGGKAQRKAYQAVAGDMRLSYSQFEELETFSRFGTRLDEETRQTIERGRRVREILKQPQYQPLSVPEQISVILAVTEGLFDDIALSEIAEAEEAVRETVLNQHHEWTEAVISDNEVSDEMQGQVLETMREVLKPLLPEHEADEDSDAVD